MAQSVCLEAFRDADLPLPLSENSAQSKDTTLLVQPALKSGQGFSVPLTSSASVGPLSATEWLSQPARTTATSVSSCCIPNNKKKTFEAKPRRSHVKADKRSCVPRFLLALVIILSTGLSLTSLVYTMHLHAQLESEVVSKHQMIRQIEEMQTVLEQLKERLLERDSDISPGELPPVNSRDFQHDASATRLSRPTHALGSRAKRSDCGEDLWCTVRELCRNEVEDYFIENVARVHLIGANVTRSTNGILFWDRIVNRTTSFSPRGVKLKIDDTNGRVRGIEVDQNGVYVVYSQVVVKGKTDNFSTSRTDCAQKTVVDRGGHEEVLMRSYLTQDNEGNPYQPRGRVPVDTSIQIGLFALYRHSVVRVQLDDHLGECRVTHLEGNPHANFFGLYRVA